MKIIQIMPEFGLAGAETMCENLSYELIRQGHEVVIISLYTFHSPITDRLENSGVKVVYLDKKPGLDFSIIMKLVKVFKMIKPDVIHTHRYVMQYAIPAAIFTGIKKRIHTVHNVAIKENSKMARVLNGVFYRGNNVIPVALSNRIKETIIKEYRLDPSRIPVIFNGIDLSKCVVKHNYGVKNYFTILHVGRFTEQKNHQMLIKAFSKVLKSAPNCVLQLIGDGETRLEIESLVITLQIEDKVKFLGLKDDVYNYMNSADLFVLPSLYEGMPMTLIEAMGSGLPIIATEVGGIPDILVNGQEAVLTDVKEEELTEAILKLYADEKERRKLGQNARNKSSLFSAMKMAESYVEVYSK